MTRSEQHNIADTLITSITKIQKKKQIALKCRSTFKFFRLLVIIGWISYIFIGTLLIAGNMTVQSRGLTYFIIPVALLILFTKLANLPKSYEKKENKFKQELYNHRIKYFQEIFNLTQAQLEYDLTGILNAHISFKDNWWLTNESADVIENALNQKYKRTANEETKADLHIENLKLQNESLEIDNTQKKFWVCSFCGNTNRGDDMSCIKCGGTRP